MNIMTYFMKKALLLVPLFINCAPTENNKPNIPEPQPLEYTFSKTPSWADEFNYEGLPDPSKWGYDTGSPYNGWGNNELQYYTEARKENVNVSGGTLKITARKEKMEGLEYTSTRLVSRGKYGPKPPQAAVPGRPYGCCLLTALTATGRIQVKLISWNMWAMIPM